jgi:hypothetical protein
MEKPLIVDQKELHQFHGAIGGDVRAAFELGNNRHLSCQKYEAVGTRTVDSYRLVDNSEYGTQVRNLRGNDIDVFPVPMDRSEVLLVGVSFDWAGSGKKFRFSSAQIIVFSGRKRPGSRKLEIEGDTRQLLRLEWAGRSDSGLFEALAHAHPHWQVDAMPGFSAAPAIPTEPQVMDLADLRGERAPASKTWLSHLHLPSAAIGWMKGEGWKGDHNDCTAHANSPASIAELRAWVGSAARYLNHQLQNAVT